MSKSKLPQVIGEEQFNSLPKSEKKILIAKDALEWFKVGYIKIESGCYINKCYNVEKSCDISATSKEAHDEYNQRPCVVCAKGGLFFSTMMRLNEITINELVETNEDEFLPQMKNIFSIKEWELIELVFEGQDVQGRIRFGEKTHNQIYAWRNLYLNEWGGTVEEDKLFVSICVNIIHNEGNFIVPKTKQELVEFEKVVENYVKSVPKLKKIFS